MAATKSPVREAVAKMFLESLYQERLPWTDSWSRSRPQNPVTGKNYRGINRFWLSQVAEDNGWTDPRWCTYKQASDQGWQVRKGEKASRVEYWAYYDSAQKKLLSWSEVGELLAADPTYELNLRLNCRTYVVFNAAQIDGIPALSERQLDIGSLRNQRDTLLSNMGVGFREQGCEAFYSPSHDCINMPPEGIFQDTYSYMATLLHESGHATGHPSRLNRNLSGGFGSENYAREELRAEIASAFVAQDLGLPQSGTANKNRHIAYIQSWISCLEKNPDELMRAINDAEQIADYLIEKGEFHLEHERTDLKEWYIVEGNADDLAIVPATELQGREVIETFQCAGLLDAMEKLHRYEELQHYFWNETNDPETREWREDLTPDEAAMVERWDFQTAKGLSDLASAVLERITTAELIMVAIESTDDYTDANFHQDLINIDHQNPDGSWGTVVDRYRLVTLGDTGRVETLDDDLVFQTKAQAKTAAESIPYARLVDYDTLVHEAGKNLTAKFMPGEISGSSDRQEKEAPETMTVVLVEPDRQARIAELPHTLEAMQKAVGGSIEAVYPFEDPVMIICNEEGKLNGLPLNRGLYGDDGKLYDIICGSFFVAGCGAEDLCSLSPKLAEKYLEQFRSPEQFLRINGNIVGLKTEQTSMGKAHSKNTKTHEPSL